MEQNLNNQIKNIVKELNQDLYKYLTWIYMMQIIISGI